MRRRPVRCLGSAIVLGLVGVACTGSDRGLPSTTTAAEPVEFETLPPFPDVATTEVPVDSLPPATPVEPGVVIVDDQISTAVDPFAFRTPTVVDFAGLPLTDVAVSPSGAWFAINRDTEICLLDPSKGSVSSDDGCVDVAGSIVSGSLAWSPDEATVAFTLNGPERLDVAVLDVASQGVAVLGGEGADGADVDVTPFFSDDGTLHFLRASADPFSFNIIAWGDPPITLGGLEADGFPGSARRDPVSGAVIVEVFQQDSTSIETIDLVEGTSTLVASELDSINRRPFLDVMGGRALIGQGPVPEVSGIRAALIDLRGGASPQAVPSMPADSGRGVAGVGLSPDGTAIIMIVVDRNDPVGHQLVVAPILDDGSVGPLGVVATGEQFAPNNGDKTIRPHGLGEQAEVVWTPEKIVFGLGPDQIVTLDLDS